MTVPLEVQQLKCPVQTRMSYFRLPSKRRSATCCSLLVASLNRLFNSDTLSQGTADPSLQQRGVTTHPIRGAFARGDGGLTNDSADSEEAMC